LTNCGHNIRTQPTFNREEEEKYDLVTMNTRAMIDTGMTLKGQVSSTIKTVRTYLELIFETINNVRDKVDRLDPLYGIPLEKRQPPIERLVGSIADIRDEMVILITALEGYLKHMVMRLQRVVDMLQQLGRTASPVNILSRILDEIGHINKDMANTLSQKGGERLKSIQKNLAMLLPRDKTWASINVGVCNIQYYRVCVRDDQKDQTY
jgi:hypothetical protein